ncbi:MAG: hypothetical protein JW944_00455 [Deltaproteobacteria bacterium]|nr:hypothetical protein [Deltaproteobacteria bacterium]
MKHGDDTRCDVSDEGSFRNLVKRLSYIIKLKRDKGRPVQQDVGWTKETLIVPLLEGLGWDKRTDILYGAGLRNKGGLDLILNCQTPVGIQIRSLNESPPQNIKHPQIKDGFMKCMAKKLAYFIWTNGDSWQFFSLALKDAAFYEVCLSKIDKDNSLLDRLYIIKKDVFISIPSRFNKAIIENTELMVLSHAWTTTLKNHTKELLQVFRKGLRFVNIKDESILKFLKTFKPEGPSSQLKSSVTFELNGMMTQRRSFASFNYDRLSQKGVPPSLIRSEDLSDKKKPSVSLEQDSLFTQTPSFDRAPKIKDWERLIVSYESHYRLARWFFQTGYYRRLGEYLISKDYEPWSKDSTWRHLGLHNGANEEKKVRHAVSLFMEWGFIEESEGDEYFRVEGSSPYLKKLLEKTA